MNSRCKIFSCYRCNTSQKSVYFLSKGQTMKTFWREFTAVSVCSMRVGAVSTQVGVVEIRTSKLSFPGRLDSVSLSLLKRDYNRSLRSQTKTKNVWKANSIQYLRRFLSKKYDEIYVSCTDWFFLNRKFVKICSVFL